jgi:cell division inhibitor SepF
MAAMWRKAMLYLGLGPDDEYDDYESGYDDPAPAQQPRSRAPQSAYGPPSDEPSAIGAVRPIGGPRDSVGEPAIGAVATRPRPQVVRPITVTPNAKPNVVVPTSFDQAQEVADTFKRNQPVIVNLQAADRDLARRLIDFASGLCYGLAGQMEKVANQVYLLTPTNVEVSAEERRRLHERGYDS